MVITLPGYEIKKAVYIGQQFSIFSGFDSEANKDVYIKACNATYPDIDDIARLNHEYELANSLNSDEIIKIYRLVHHHNTLALVMESIRDGSSLDTLVKSGPMDMARFFNIAVNITKGLMRIHAAHIIHKDIKPANIIIFPDYKKIKIIDFGISVKLNRERTSISYENLLEGSLPYVSPEQTGCLNAELDYRADFYSLGCTFYEMLIGKTPFEAKDKDGWIKQHLNLIPKPLDEINLSTNRVNNPLSRVVLKLLEKMPEKRYQSCYGLLQDLELCKEMNQESKNIHSFVPGGNDHSDKFLVSNKLYGRESEIRKLKKGVEEIHLSKKVLCTIDGYSGIGKTSIVNELRYKLKSEEWLFVSGKCDQFEKNIPYKVITDCFSSILNGLLSEPDDILNQWAIKIQTALGDHAGAITRILPQLEGIIGKQAVMEGMNLKEAHNRFILTFCKFVSLFSTTERPLILFLDDMQWCGTATLEVLKAILTNTSVMSLMIIMTYRSNEVGVGHPLANLLNELENTTTRVKLSIGPLKQKAISALVSDTVHDNSHKANLLADCIYEKAKGNPFFTKQLLESFYINKLITYDPKNGKWDIDIDKIRKAEISHNVIDLILSRIRGLPNDTIDILKAASCIGNTFSLKELSHIINTEHDETNKAIWCALNNEIITPISGKYHLLSYKKSTDSVVIFRFMHDNIQKAIYELINDKVREELHYKLSRYYKNNSSDIRKDSIKISNHFRKSLDIAKQKESTYDLASILFMAGMKALESSAFKISYHYFETILDLLKNDYWDSQYDLLWDTSYNMIRCSYLIGKYEKANTLIKNTLKHSTNKTDKSKILILNLEMNSMLSNYEEAIESGLNALNYLGVKIARHPKLMSVILKTFHVKYLLFSKNIEDTAYTEMDDKVSLLVMETLGHLISPVYLASKPGHFLLPVIILQGVTLSLKNGFSKESSSIFQSYAFMLREKLNDPTTADKFAKLGIDIAVSGSSIGYASQNYFLYALLSYGWKYSINDMRPLFIKAMEYGIEYGDYQHAAYSAFHANLYNYSLPLDDIIQYYSEQISFVYRTEHTDIYNHMKMTISFFSCLCGKLASLTSFDNKEFDERPYLDSIMSKNMGTYIAQYHLFKLQVLYHNNLFSEAVFHIKKLDEYYDAIAGMILTVDASVFTFLIYITLIYDIKIDNTKGPIKRVNHEYKRVKKWAKHCPENFTPFKYLMEAEFASAKGKDKIANELYEKASSCAKETNNLRYDAIICERGALFCNKAQDYSHKAKDRVIESYILYHRLGMKQKCKILKEMFPSYLQEMK